MRTELAATIRPIASSDVDDVARIYAVGEGLDPTKSKALVREWLVEGKRLIMVA
jgi:hypothetical protein